MKDRTDSGPLWSVPFAVADIPDIGRRVELSADAPTRAAIAKAAGLAALPRLEANFDLTRRGLDRVRVSGTVSGTVGQTCVVTLEPVESTIEEQVDLIFAPPTSEHPAESSDAEPTGKNRKPVKDEDDPEPLRNGTFDLGAVAVEFLLLGIDPYPRKPGAVFEAPTASQDPASHPFAALAALRTGRKDG